MPIVKISVYEGMSREYKKALLDGIHAALVAAFRIPENDRTQVLYELPEENFERHGRPSKHFTLVEIVAFQGRSFEAKKKLYTAIVENLARNPGIDENDVLIVLTEPPLENWGIKGGRPANEAGLSFDIHV